MFLLKSSTQKDKNNSELKYMANVLSYLTYVLIPQTSSMKEATKMSLSVEIIIIKGGGTSADSDIHHCAVVLHPCLCSGMVRNKEHRPCFTNFSLIILTVFRGMGREVLSSLQEPSIHCHWGTATSY